MAIKLTNEKFEERLVKHVFTKDERLELGESLARAHAAARSAESEFEAIKGQFKAKLAEAESKVEAFSNQITDGFTMRNKRCKVVFRPKDRQKDYFPEIKDGVFDTKAAITEPMTSDDFAADLFEAESQFERRAEVRLFKDAIMVLGRLKDKWHAALRVTIGQQKLSERLDPAAKKFKHRADAFQATVDRLNEWITAQFGEEAAKGFADDIAKVAKVQKEMVE